PLEAVPELPAGLAEPAVWLGHQCHEILKGARSDGSDRAVTISLKERKMGGCQQGTPPICNPVTAQGQTYGLALLAETFFIMSCCNCCSLGMSTIIRCCMAFMVFCMIVGIFAVTALPASDL